MTKGKDGKRFDPTSWASWKPERPTNVTPAGVGPATVTPAIVRG